MWDDPYEWNALSCIHFPLEFHLDQTNNMDHFYVSKIFPCTRLITHCYLNIAHVSEEKVSSDVHWAPSTTVPSPKLIRANTIVFWGSG